MTNPFQKPLDERPQSLTTSSQNGAGGFGVVALRRLSERDYQGKTILPNASKPQFQALDFFDASPQSWPSPQFEPCACGHPLIDHFGPPEEFCLRFPCQCQGFQGASSPKSRPRSSLISVGIVFLWLLFALALCILGFGMTIGLWRVSEAILWPTTRYFGLGW